MRRSTSGVRLDRLHYSTCTQHRKALWLPQPPRDRVWEPRKPEVKAERRGIEPKLGSELFRRDSNPLSHGCEPFRPLKRRNVLPTLVLGKLDPQHRTVVEVSDPRQHLQAKKTANLQIDGARLRFQSLACLTA